MSIERMFAADVFAAVNERHPRGMFQSLVDRVEGCLADLWTCGRALGYSANDIQAIADRYIAITTDGDVQVRSLEGGNVVRLDHRAAAGA